MTIFHPLIFFPVWRENTNGGLALKIPISQFSSSLFSLQPIKYIVKKKKRKKRKGVPSADGLRKNERKLKKVLFRNGLKKMDESPKDVFLKVQRLRVFL